MVKSAQCWSNQSESTRQDCFDHVDWKHFRVESVNSVTGFIKKCIDDVIAIVTFKTYLNQKLSIDDSLVGKLKERDAAYQHGKVARDNSMVKQYNYDLLRLIKMAKHK